jgi:hypothetical protein
LFIHLINHLFKYFVSVTDPGWEYAKRAKMEQEFLEWQNWCWNTYGQGSERDWAYHLKDTIKWAWDTRKSHLPRLYLKGDAELMMFKLKWC